MSAESDPIITTERLFVRFATPGDVDMLYALWTDPRVMTHVGFPKGLKITKDQINEQLRSESGRILDAVLITALNSTSQSIGQVKIGSPDERGISETDVKLFPAFWGHGYGLEIKLGLVDYLFTHTDAKIVQATPNVSNIASIRMQERAGGKRVGEGIFEFPEYMKEDTQPVPHYIYHIHREDWEKKREK